MPSGPCDLVWLSVRVSPWTDGAETTKGNDEEKSAMSSSKSVGCGEKSFIGSINTVDGILARFCLFR